MNTENAVKSLEIARKMAKEIQDSTTGLIDSLSKFYTAIGEDTIDDLKKEWKRKQTDGAPSLYDKMSIGVELVDGKKVVKLSDKLVNFQPAKWEVILNREESIELAHQLLREWRVMS